MAFAIVTNPEKPEWKTDYSPNEAAKATSFYYLSCYGSGIREQLSWVILTQGLS